jgi:integrase
VLIADQDAGEEAEEIKLFFSSIRSKETRKKYKSYFKTYLKMTGLTVHDIVSEKNPRTIELQIISLINKMKDEGKNYGTIHNYRSMILAFYKINDIVLNVAKINKFMPEQRRVKKDRSYLHEEISKMLQFCDERERVIILLLASSGVRIGAIPNLRVGNIDDRNNKLTVYESDREEYFTFVTPECKKAIDAYLDMRSRYGEKLEDDCYLIREVFDVRDKFAISKCRPITRETYQSTLRDIAKRSNVKSKHVANAHGFRKFFTTQLVNSDVNPEIREMLLGHKIGLVSAYYRPTEHKMYTEYQKAIDNLTIDPANRLQRKVEILTIEANKVDFALTELEKVKKQIRLARLNTR